MDNENEEFLKRLRETFRIESGEHARVMSIGLVELERTTDSKKQAEIMETMFREAHSLKGAARSVDLLDIESLCQALEGIFATLKRQEIALNPGLLDLLHQTVDRITLLTPYAEKEQATIRQQQIEEMVCQLNEAAKHASTPIKQAIPMPWPGVESPSRQADTVRISITKLSPLLLQAEEMISAKMAAGQRASELQDIDRMICLWKSESEKWKKGRSPGLGWDDLLERNEERLTALQSQVTATTKAALQDQRAFKRMVDDHLEAMKELLMLPVGLLVEVLPKLARDLARAQGKELELTIQGAEIEIDKRILEELKDPLIHLVRNCADHGIEKPENRVRDGKAPCGTIRLNFVVKDNRQMEISISDDGSGVDMDKVRVAATKLGLLQANAEKYPDPKETLQLIFHSGISTSPIITDISGRGLGLAIVREKVEKLGGTVSVISEKNAGTTFRLLVPMTLATFRGVLVRVRAYIFVLPAINVEHVLRVLEKDIKTIENRETIQLEGQILALARLGDILEFPVRENAFAADKASSRPGESYMPVIILTFAEKRMAFLVDEVPQEQDVLVKGLGEQLKRVRNIAGATILGTGKVVPVLNVQDLMRSVVRSTAVSRKAALPGITPARTGKILVAEDSITARTLLKNILETAGYQVATAVDGADAFTQLQNGEFDLVISDVDMPQMNGFELTIKIRSNKKLAELPVVLVTALDSREDKGRGIEAGANAYIIKSSFDQSNLLGVIRRFL